MKKKYNTEITEEYNSQREMKKSAYSMRKSISKVSDEQGGICMKVYKKPKEDRTGDLFCPLLLASLSVKQY